MKTSTQTGSRNSKQNPVHHSKTNTGFSSQKTNHTNKSALSEALIKGTFSPEKARDLLHTMFESKIRMHTVSSFASWAKTGSESSHDNERVKELKLSLMSLLKAIKEHEAPDSEVSIDCVVKIKFKKRSKKGN